MDDYEKAQERIRKRRDELGDAEIQRRTRLIDKAQDICHALVMHSNTEEAEPLLKLAEELRERLKMWTWRE